MTLARCLLEIVSMLAAEALEAIQAFGENVEGRAVAKPNAIVVAKSNAGNGRNFVAGQQLVA